MLNQEIIRSLNPDKKQIIPVPPQRRAGMIARPVKPERSALSDRFLELLGGAEGNLLAGLDVDRLAGSGIAAHAGGALANLEDAEADDADPVALLQVLGHLGHEVAEHRLGLLLGHLVIFRD